MSFSHRVNKYLRRTTERLRTFTLDIVQVCTVNVENVKKLARVVFGAPALVARLGARGRVLSARRQQGGVPRRAAGEARPRGARALLQVGHEVPLVHCNKREHSVQRYGGEESRLERTWSTCGGRGRGRGARGGARQLRRRRRALHARRAALQRHVHPATSTRVTTGHCTPLHARTHPHSLVDVVGAVARRVARHERAPELVHLQANALPISPFGEETASETDHYTGRRDSSDCIGYF